MKIITVCGHGLGSSLMLEMNIKNVLNELGANAEVSHKNLIDVNTNDADLFFAGRDLEDATKHLKNIILLNSIIDQTELKQKLSDYFKKNNLS